MVRPPATEDLSDIDKQFNLDITMINTVTGLEWQGFVCLRCGCLVGENHGATACRRQHLLAGCNPNRYPALAVTDK